MKTPRPVLPTEPMPFPEFEAYCDSLLVQIDGLTGQWLAARRQLERRRAVAAMCQDRAERGGTDGHS